METPSGGEVLYDGSLAETASVAVESFIQVNMSSGQETQWSNLTWPAGVKPRANAQLVWLPVSSQGVLIAIGGVIDPQKLAYGNAYDNPSQVTDSQYTGPEFMSSLPVYDIESRQWFVQDASGDVPGQLTEFCSVVAQADGSSTIEIYIYGGYDGLNGSSQGDVWVLSVPSFVWIHAYDPGSNLTHARDSHACVKPYPDQMFVIGGQDSSSACLNGMIDVFNLSSLMWLESYNPTIWSNYTIPSIVAGNISATPTATPMNQSLSAILGTRYQKTISTYYPYPPPASTSASGSKWLPAVLGTVLGVVGLLFILFAIWWFRLRKGRKSETSETQSGGDVTAWIDGVPSKPEASVTTTEVEEPGISPFAGYFEVPGDFKYRHPNSPQADTSETEAAVTHRLTAPQPVHFEAHGIERYEMCARGTHPASPQSVHFEADGAQRYEMHAVERGSPGTPAEMETPPRIRDHPYYPRDPAGVSQTMSTTSHDASSPSPYVLPQTLAETDYAISNPAAPSPRPLSPDQSPPIPSTVEHSSSHQRNASSMTTPTGNGSPDLDAIEAVSGLGYSTSRPVHTRNRSSLSSGIGQLPSPDEQVPQEEDHRRSALLAGLPAPSPPITQVEPRTVGAATEEDGIDPESQPLVNYRTPHNTTTVVTRKQVPARSAFKEEEFGSP